MFEKYTPEAGRVIFYARLEVSELGATAIETEHLLLGLLHENKPLLSRFIPSHISLNSIRRQVEDSIIIYERTSTSIEVPLSSESENALAYAAIEAKHLSHDRVAPEHILLGLLHEESSLAARILSEHGIMYSAIRKEFGSAAEE